MAFHELTQALEIDTPLGRGRALFVEAAGADADILWYVVLRTGAVVCVRNRDTRLAPNWTYNVRREEAEPALEEAAGLRS